MVRTALMLAALLAGPAFAQTGSQDDPVPAKAAGEGDLSIGLDSLVPAGEACRLTFVARNGLGDDVRPVLEAVAFDAEGAVALITLFDFGELPEGRTRVRQFDLPGIACGSVASILVNGVQSCGPAEGCEAALAVSSRAEGVEVMR